MSIAQTPSLNLLNRLTVVRDKFNSCSSLAAIVIEMDTITIGRIGFWVKDTAYKLCTIKVSKSDGSIFIGFNLGTQHVNRGIAGPKITYHPDGNTWLTADLQRRIVGREFIDNASATHITGLNFNPKGHVHIKGQDYKPQPSFNEIEEGKLIVKLKNGVELFDLHGTADYSSHFAVENNSDKLNMTNMLKGEKYFGIRTDSFLAVNCKYAAEESNATLFQYPHPSRDITISAMIKNTTRVPENTE